MLGYFAIYAYVSVERHHYLGYVSFFSKTRFTFLQDEISCWLLLAINWLSGAVDPGIIAHNGTI